MTDLRNDDTSRYRGFTRLTVEELDTLAVVKFYVPYKIKLNL